MVGRTRPPKNSRMSTDQHRRIAAFGSSERRNSKERKKALSPHPRSCSRYLSPASSSAVIHHSRFHHTRRHLRNSENHGFCPSCRSRRCRRSLPGPGRSRRMAPIPRRRKRHGQSFLQGRLRAQDEQARGLPHPFSPVSNEANHSPPPPWNP
ncbi:hypothetical protein CTA2_1253, partial [Colletotrichum tanaceti]